MNSVMVLDPVVVLVAASNEARLEEMCEAAASIDGCTVIGAVGGRVALQHVVSRYELPSGCPDVVVLDADTPGLEELHAAFEETCPGVKRLEARDIDAMTEQLRETARLIEQSFVF